MRFRIITFLLLWASSAKADPPVASYIFPAGGQRGKSVAVRVGGLNLHSRCGFELLGTGVTADRELKRTNTVWFDGPILPLPESQQQEDYPKDMAGTIRIAADAQLGVRIGRVWTSQGASSGLAFVVGELPEMVENEIDGPATPVKVSLPVTINGRIFPREDVDEWAFMARTGQTIVAEAMAGKLGFPLEPRLEILDSQSRRLAENETYPGTIDARVRFIAPADGEYRVRIMDARMLGGQQYVYRLTIVADPKPEAVETDTPATSKPVALPATIRGRIDKAEKVDSWPVELKKGASYEIDLQARRINSPLIAVLVVRDAAGKELSRLDSSAQNVDPKLTFTPPSDGIHRIEVAERFHSRGGSQFVYSLKVAPQQKPVPDFKLHLAADTFNLPRGAKGKLKVTAERIGGFAGPIELAVEGLPEGVSIARTTLAANQPAVEIPLEAKADAVIRVAKATVLGTAKIGDKTESRIACLPAAKGLPEVDSILLAVALPTPFVVTADYLLTQASRGTVFPRRYRIERKGFTGPITVRLADRQARHLQGVTGPTLVVAPDKNEFDYPIAMPPWMETGRTCRCCIMAVGEVKDRDGTIHEVSFSSVEQNMQIIVVVEPGRLGLELEKTSVRAEAGGEVKLSFRVQRGDGLKGPATVELLPMPGVSGATVTIAADQSAGVIALRIAKDGLGVVTTAVLRASVMHEGKPVVAEAKADLVPGK
jgi:hypothetical protein